MAIGDNIRPELGRTDYTPFLQGSAAGSSAMGQGLQQLGKGAGQFVGDINEAKKEKAGALSFLKAARGMVDDPKRAEAIDGMINQLETVPLRDAVGIAKQAKSALSFLGDQLDRDMMEQSIFFDQSIRANAAIREEERHQAQMGALGDAKDRERGRVKGKQAIASWIAAGSNPAELPMHMEMFAPEKEEEAEAFSELVAEGVASELEKRSTMTAKSQQERREDIKFISDMRKQFEGLAPVKDYDKVNAAYAKVQAASKDPSAAGDLSLIFNYMKILDPGSVVRENEQASAQNAAGVPARIRNVFNRIRSGERLNPEQRKDFAQAARKTAKAQWDTLQGTVKNYNRLAREAGISPEDIVAPYYSSFGGGPFDPNDQEGTRPARNVFEMFQQFTEEAQPPTSPNPGVLPPKP